MKVIPLGESALVVRVPLTLDQPKETLSLVLTTIKMLRDADLPGVTEIAPAFASIGVFFDPCRLAAAVATESPTEWLRARIGLLLEEANERAQLTRRPRTVEIPVCYESEFAPDLATIAQRAGLGEEEVGQRHSAAEYRVHCIGFTPGFPYLSGLPPELATPRRATPRTQVRKGSVAIGGPQTGIYPQASPGGWNVIGCTPLQLFNAQQDPPALLEAGDRVRFRSINRAEFESWGQ